MNWIKTSERLPEEGKEVVAHCGSDFEKVWLSDNVWHQYADEDAGARFDKFGRPFHPWADIKGTHWMEIEEPREE